MDKYVDDKYAIINGTLMACMDGGSKVVIPASVNGHVIDKIGSGCAINRNVKSVVISEGITKIAEDALFLPIYSNHKLWAAELVLPKTVRECEWFNNGQIWRNFTHIRIKRRFLQDEFESLQRESILLQDGRRLIGKNHGGEIAFSGEKGDFLSKAGWTAPYYHLEMNGVYSYWEWGNDDTSIKYLDNKRPEQLAFMDRRKKVDDLHSATAVIFRKALVRIMLKEPQEMVFSNICEQRNDETELSRENENRWIERALLVYYDDDDVYMEQEDVIVEFHLENCYMHFPALKKVAASGKTYYIYCENYFASDSEVPYNRIVYTDEVYDAEGNAVDSNTARRVSAKYKLISMLM